MWQKPRHTEKLLYENRIFLSLLYGFFLSLPSKLFHAIASCRDAQCISILTTFRNQVYVFHEMRTSLLNVSLSHVHGALWQRETVWRFYFDFALHLSINRYLESDCGLLESICRRANGGSVGWASKGGEKDVARKGPRRVERQTKTLVLIPYPAAKTERGAKFLS